MCLSNSCLSVAFRRDMFSSHESEVNTYTCSHNPTVAH